jgi:sugar lactone lactonase YvrE
VLRFDSPHTDMQAADLVLGQPDFHTFALGCYPQEQGNVMCEPTDVAVDTTARIYVTDAGDNAGETTRGVMRFDQPHTNGQAPDVILTACPVGAHNGRCSGYEPAEAHGLAVSSGGALYVTDPFSQRVWRFSPPLFTKGPDLQLGKPDQPDEGRGTPCNVGGLSAQTLCGPSGVTLDTSGSVYLADRGNNRVLRFDQPHANSQPADFVLGQPDFSSGDCNLGGVSASSLCGPSDVMLDFRGPVRC